MDQGLCDDNILAIVLKGVTMRVKNYLDSNDVIYGQREAFFIYIKISAYKIFVALINV